MPARAIPAGVIMIVLLVNRLYRP